MSGEWPVDSSEVIFDDFFIRFEVISAIKLADVSFR